jgi:hypothetical protein
VNFLLDTSRVDAAVLLKVLSSERACFSSSTVFAIGIMNELKFKTKSQGSSLIDF